MDDLTGRKGSNCPFNRCRNVSPMSSRQDPELTRMERLEPRSQDMTERVQLPALLRRDTYTENKNTQAVLKFVQLAAIVRHNKGPNLTESSHRDDCTSPPPRARFRSHKGGNQACFHSSRKCPKISYIYHCLPPHRAAKSDKGEICKH